jgi:transposase
MSKTGGPIMQYANISHKYQYFCGGDMHAKSTYFVVMDRSGTIAHKGNLPNQFNAFKEFINPFIGRVVVGVESNFNYPWLSDGCDQENIRFLLGHAPYMRAIAGNKQKNDRLDAMTIANLLRTNFFPIGYAFPKENRNVRDLLRRRHFFVHQRAGLITHSKLTLHQQGINDSNASVFKNKQEREKISQLIPEADVRLNLDTNVQVISFLDHIIDFLEKTIKKRVYEQYLKAFALLQTIPGVGEMTAWIILYETCDIGRFKTHQHYASYCRVVKPERMSNGVMKKGGNPKMGNPYLKWAFGQILHNARPANEEIDRFYLKLERKYGKRKARAMMAHKFNTTAYFMIKNETSFDLDKFLNRK